MKEILCFGDSNTYGLIPGTLNRYEREARWTGILDQQVRKLGYVVSEEGLCGRTTVFDDPFRAGRNGAELLPVILETHSPIDIAVVMLGTNDCKAHIDASANIIGLGIKKIVQQIKKFDNGIKILLVSPILLGDDVFDGFDLEFNAKSVRVSKELGAVYEEIAKDEGLYFLRASDYAIASDDDREHMDRGGHRKLAHAIYDEINDIIAGGQQ